MRDDAVEKERDKRSQAPVHQQHYVCDDAAGSSHGQGMESQVIASLTATITQQNDKSDGHYQSPLPIERENACLFPLWMVISILLLSLVGILGGVFELIVQFQ
jgi:hypothetical protein